MKNFRLAWNRAMENKRCFFYLIAINLLNSLALGVVTAMFNQMGDSWFISLINFILAALEVILAYFTLISSLHLLTLTVMGLKQMTFSEMYKEFFEFAFSNWKKYLKTYALWNILFAFLCAVGIGMIFSVITFLMSGSFLFDFINMISQAGYYIQYMDASDLASLLMPYTPAILMIVCVGAIGSFLASVFSSSISYYGVYRIAGEENGIQYYSPKFSDCFLLALMPMLVSNGIGLLLILGTLFLLMASPILGIFFMLFDLFIGILILIGLVLYSEVSYVKILFDIHEYQSDCGLDDLYDPNFSNQYSPAPEKPLPDLPNAHPGLDKQDQ